MVTTLNLETATGSSNDMNKMYSMAIERFDAMLRAENCQIINVTNTDASKGFWGRKQAITVVGTGESKNIKSSYRVHSNIGLFGILTGVTFY